MLVLYIILSYFMFLFGFIGINLLKANPQRTLAKDQNKLRGTGISFEEKRETNEYSVLRLIEDGIERTTYTPKVRKHEIPILMLHGMWHGAWCWENWQEYLCQQGWEVISFSLPGHAKSIRQRPIFLCTLDYYLSFLRDEVNRLPRKPIIMGHSMGGALIQWYFKYLGDNLPAAVLVAPWVAKNAYLDGLPLFLKLDSIGVLQTFIRLDAGSYIRSPKRAANALISKGASYTPEELHAKLNTESALVLFQHMPPIWYAPKDLKTPTLLAAAEDDVLVSFNGLKNSAEYFGAKLLTVPNSGHNLMMEATAPETIEKINLWLEEQAIS